MVPFRHWFAAFVCLAFIRCLTAQNVPWTTPVATPVTSSLTIACIPLVNGNALATGDYIGVFSDSGTCFGLAQWKDTINLKINVYGTDGILAGFAAGDRLNLKVWLHQDDCILDHIAEISSAQPLLFSNTMANSVVILDFTKASVTFPRQQYCLNEAIPVVPQESYPVADLAFTTGAGLDIDPSTGKVNLAQSQPGTYQVAISSTTCLAENKLSLKLNDFPHITPVPDTFICGDHLTLRSTNIGNEQVLWSTGETSPEITLSQPATVWYKVTNSQGCSNADTFAVQKMAIASLDYTTRKADCYSPGGLEISNQDILNGKPPYGYQLVNDIDSSTTEDLNHLREGLYTLEVINANGCVLKYSPKLLIAKDCLNDKPVFTPNADGMNDRYFINFEGRLEVFDRNGRLRRRLTGPCYFDGKDENGHPLSMGVYLIVSEKKQTMTLTIVR